MSVLRLNFEQGIGSYGDGLISAAVSRFCSSRTVLPLLSLRSPFNNRGTSPDREIEAVQSGGLIHSFFHEPPRNFEVG